MSDTQFEELNNRLKELDKRINRLETRLEKISDKVDALRGRPVTATIYEKLCVASVALVALSAIYSAFLK